IPKCSRWDTHLFQARDRNQTRTTRIAAQMGDVAGRELRRRNSESGDVSDIIISGILAIEEVEEFRECPQCNALANRDDSRQAQIDLGKWRAPELIQAGGDTIDNGAIIIIPTIAVHVDRHCERKRTRAFELRQCAEFNAPWQLQSSRENKAMTYVFARRPMISGAERITHIRHAIDVVEQLSDYCTPRACTRKSVVGGHIEAPREPMTHEQRNAIIARPVIRSENRDVRRGTAVGVEQSHSADIFIAAILV